MSSLPPAQTKPGLLESAEGGTVFLDEVGELPLSLQAKLLWPSNRMKSSVWAARAPRVDVRFVAATNRDLEEAVRAERFRADLYCRLGCVSLLIPALRDRPADILPLAEHFLRRAASQYRRQSAVSLLPHARAALCRYPWPGNIHELRNVLERAVLLADRPVVTAALLDLKQDRIAAPAAHRTTVPGATERGQIAAALAACAGNQTKADEALGVSRRTLVRRMSELQLPRPRSIPGGTSH